MTRLAYLIVALAGVGWCQSPGVQGRSANAHGPSQWPGYLGVGILEVTPERAKALGLAEASGVEVARVDDDTPASKAGLKSADVILAVNGQKIQTGVQFITIIGVGLPGSKVTLTVWREGRKLTLNAVLDSRPAQMPAYRVEPENLGPLTLPPLEIMPMPSPMIGFDGETLTPQLADYFGVREGVLVRTVGPRTPAEKAGLKAGAVLVRVNGTPVDSMRAFSGVIRAGHKAFAFTVVRNRKEMTLNVEVALEFEPWIPCAVPALGGAFRGGWSLALFPLR